MMLRRLLPRLGDFLFVIVLAGSMLLGERMLNVDSDLGRHLALGTYMLETVTVPVHDVLSFTRAGESRPPYEWLAQIGFSVFHKLLGLDGVVLLAGTAIAAAFMLSYRDGRDRSGAPLLALLVSAWAAAASSLHWLTRPHIFTFVFLVIWIRLLEQMRLGRLRGLWQLPLVMLLWANVHAGFVYGFLAWGAYLFGWEWDRRRRQASTTIGSRYLLAGAGALVASAITPDLWNNWAAVFGNTSAYVLGRTVETLPADLGTPATWPFAALVIAAAALAVSVRRAIAPAHAAILLGFGAISLAFARNIPLFCLAATPILTQWARRALEPVPRFTRFEDRMSLLESGLRGRFWPPLAVLLTTVFLALSASGSKRSLYSFDAASFPVKAVDWIIEHPSQGNMLNELNWGGYILYRLWPAQRVFIDSQSDFYGEEFIREYESTMSGRGGWADLLRDWQVEWMIIAPESRLASLARLEPEWQVTYEDATAVILVRLPDQ
jgi:hypothetical protein